MYLNTLGLVLRETPYKESSKMLTVLTAAEGKLSVSAKGALKRGSRIAAASQLLAFSEMTLLESRGRWTLTEARSVELFRGLREDVERLSLGSYFAELLEAASDGDSRDASLLSLGLNCIYALSEGKKQPEAVKAAFELRLMCLSGYAPQTDACGVCGSTEPEEPCFDLAGGTVVCASCRKGYPNDYARLCASSLDALRYVCSCEPKKLLSFRIGAEALRRLSEVSERYTLTQLDRSFKTLDFYKALRIQL